MSEKFELTIEDLKAERAAELPEREAMGVFNWSSIWASNTAVAVNAFTNHSGATATAQQAIWVNQENEFGD